MSIPRNCFGPLIEAVLMAGAKKATYYLNAREVVKATYQGKRDKRARYRTVVVTIGAPNYRERMFVKKAKRDGAKLKFPLTWLRRY